jgi:hypothetical protein
LSIPATRQQFKDYCLRKLGSPILNIDLTSEMIDDRIDQAITYWQQFHVEGTLLQYYSYQVQAQDITNRYITLPTNVIGVGKLFDVSAIFGSSDIFSVTWQFVQSQIFNMSSIQVAPYWMMMQNLQQLQQVLVGQKFIRFNQFEGNLYIDMDWPAQTVAGNYLVVEVYVANDPEVFPRIWGDIWLQRYSIAQIKKNWGEVLCKYLEMPLTGGLKVDGHRLLTEAQTEIDNLEKEMFNTWSIPIGVLTG